MPEIILTTGEFAIARAAAVSDRAAIVLAKGTGAYGVADGLLSMGLAEHAAIGPSDRTIKLTLAGRAALAAHEAKQATAKVVPNGRMCYHAFNPNHLCDPPRQVVNHCKCGAWYMCPTCGYGCGGTGKHSCETEPIDILFTHEHSREAFDATDKPASDTKKAIHESGEVTFINRDGTFRADGSRIEPVSESALLSDEGAALLQERLDRGAKLRDSPAEATDPSSWKATWEGDQRVITSLLADRAARIEREKVFTADQDALKVELAEAMAGAREFIENVHRILRDTVKPKALAKITERLKAMKKPENETRPQAQEG